MAVRDREPLWGGGRPARSEHHCLHNTEGRPLVTPPSREHLFEDMGRCQAPPPRPWCLRIRGVAAGDSEYAVHEHCVVRGCSDSPQECSNRGEECAVGDEGKKM